MNRTARSIAAAGLLLACFWLAPLGVQPAASAPSEPEVLARVGFGQGVYNVTVGDDFTVAIVVDDADALGGWEAALTYDPAVVRPAGLAAGAFLASTGRAAALLGPDGDPGSGPVALGGYSWGPTGGIPNGVSGDGELAQVALHAVAVGGSVLNLAGPVLRLGPGRVGDDAGGRAAQRAGQRLRGPRRAGGHRGAFRERYPDRVAACSDEHELSGLAKCVPVLHAWRGGQHCDRRLACRLPRTARWSGGRSNAAIRPCSRHRAATSTSSWA